MDKKKYSQAFEEQIKNYQKEFFSPQFRDIQAKIYNEQSQQQVVNERDIQLWERFKQIVQDKRAKSPNKKAYFSFDDVEALKVKADLVFIYGGKNIGKTYATSQLVTKILDKPKAQVLMLRNTRSEVENGFPAQLEYEEWPILKSANKLIRKPGYLKNRGESVTRKTAKKKVQKITKKELTEEEFENAVDNEEVKLYDADHCGYVTCITGLGLRSYQGASYTNLRTVIWDECNDLGDVNEQDILRTQIFMLSIERNNPDFKVYMLGNLLRHETGAASNIFLDFFGIAHDCNLKYITANNGLKILYINTGEAGELYDGVKDQKFSQMYGTGLSEDLFSNKPLSYSSKVLSKNIFLTKCEPVLAFVYHEEEQFWNLYLGSYTSEEGTYYVMRIERFEKSYNHPGYYPVTDNVDAVNQFGNVQYIRPIRAGKLVEKIFKLNQYKKIFFADDQTRMRWTNKASNKLKARYSQEINRGF